MLIKNKTGISSFLIIALLALSIFFSSRLVFEEDVSKLVPSDSRQEKLNSILKNSSYFDRLVVMVSFKDTARSADPDALIPFASKIVEELQSADTAKLIKEITFAVDDKMIGNLLSEIYDNIPIFLDSADYRSIDSMLDKKSVSRNIERCYKLLISPAGILAGKTMMRDPLGITFLTLKKVQALRFSDSYILYNGYIFTQDKKNLLLFISPVNPSSETNKNTQLFSTIDKTIETVTRQYGNELSAEYFGGLAVTIENASRVKQDIIITVLLAVILLVIFITYFVRIRWAAFLTFLPAIFGALISLAVIYLLRGRISSISLGIGSILLGIGVDYALYILSQLDEKLSLAKVIRKLWYPILICSLTTASVFFILLYVKTEALHDLGLFMAISIMAASLFAILIMPLLFRLLKISSVTSKGTNQNKFVVWFTSYRTDQNKWIIVGSLILTVVFFITTKKVDFDSDMTKMSYMSDKLKNAENKLKAISDFSLNNLIVISSGQNIDEALHNNEDAVLKLERLKNKGLVKEVSTISGLITSSKEQNKRIDRWRQYWTSEKKIGLKKNIIESSMQLGFNPKAFDAFYSALNKNYTSLSVQSLTQFHSSILSNWLFNTDSSYYVMNICKVNSESKIKVSSELINSPTLYVSDRHSIVTNLITTLRKDFDFLINLSSIFILIILIVALGRIELGIITFIPIIISWIWTTGIMGMFGENFTIFNIIIATLIFGTGVDYCILIMRALQEEYTTGENVLKYYKSGIFLSSATTIIGVGVLYFAKHPSLRSIALLPIAGFISVVFLTFTLEPVMMRWLLLRRKEMRSYPITIMGILSTTVAYSYFISGCFLLFGLGTTIFGPFPLTLKRKKKIFAAAMSAFCSSILAIMWNMKYHVINPRKENYDKPAVIVCNHQSVLDILTLISQSPKVILLTNNWVWNSPLFGKVVQYAGFCPVMDGVESLLPNLEKKVKEGYSIVIFPEGTRSKDGKIARFHKGAFYLAQNLKIDILPLVIHGACDVIKKGEFLFRTGILTLKYLERIPYNEEMHSENTSLLTKRVCSLIRNEYAQLKSEIETPVYFKDKLIKNYIYKKTTLETYLRIKLKVENYYREVIENTPLNAIVTDLGCGYGFLTYLLIFTSGQRKIFAVDHDPDKITLAKNCFSNNDSIEFINENILSYEIKKSDTIILYDVLHYLMESEQRHLLIKCMNSLNDNGVILIRDANLSREKSHVVSKSIEKLSVGFRFNKSNSELEFFTDEFLRDIAGSNGFILEKLNSSIVNSNELYIIKKMGENKIL